MTLTSVFNHRLKLTAWFLIVLFAFTSGAHADQLTERVKELNQKREEIIKSIDASKPEEVVKAEVHVRMIDRQISVGDSYSSLKKRVDQLNVRDPRKVKANDLLKEAEIMVFTGRRAFLMLDVTTDSSLTADDPYRPSDQFNQEEKTVISSLNQVNRQLLTPVRPGTTLQNGKEEGGVPEGDIIDDFIPGLIRLLFRFVTLVIFISFLVSGVMFITAFGNDDQLTKARRILYYSLIGFAVVTLAFAIVKAVTDIDFFGFI